MPRTRFQQITAALLVAALLTASFATLVTAAPEGVAVAQETPLRATTVEGTIPGGQFAEIWLDLETTNIGQNITLTSVWDTFDLGGLTFYVLDETNRADVVSGTHPRDANISAGNPVQDFRGAGNQQEASFRATAAAYTIIVKNESANDADFTLSATNGTIIDNGNNVVDPTAPAATDTEESAAEGEATDTDEAAAESTTPEAAATETTTPTVATETTAPAATDTVTTTAEAETTAPAAAESDVDVNESGVVSAKELSGELPNQDDQHFFGLEPSVKDGRIFLSLKYEPQDQKDLSRRLNFWVLNEDGFRKFQEGARLSTVAIAAGSPNVDTAENERVAEVQSSGTTPFTVIVYNSSSIPAQYTITADGGLLIDDSGQSTTAAEAVAAPEAVAEEDTAATTATATGTTTDTTTSTTTRTTVTSDAGETYTVQSGDTLSLIAQAVYDDINAYTVICEKNQIPDCNVIEVGDVLVLPTEEEVAAGTATPVAAASTPEVESTETTTPTVGAGTEVTGTAELTGTGTITVSGTLTDTEGITDTATTTGTATNNIVDILQAEGNFQNLLASLDAADLTGALETTDPLTLFAPTDAAFAALPEGAVTQLLADTGPESLLTQILLYHALPSKLMSEDLSDGLAATTLQGDPVTFQVTDDGIAINGAPISKADLEATNGVVHVIDAIILPPQQ